MMNIFYRMTRENISPISHLSTPIGQTLSYWTDVSALCARTTRRGVTAYMGVGSVQSCPGRVRPTWERQIYSSAIILLATLVLRSDQSFMAWWDILGSSSFPTIIQTTNFSSQISEKSTNSDENPGKSWTVVDEFRPGWRKHMWTNSRIPFWTIWSFTPGAYRTPSPL